jgi:hypothetical protein
MSVPHLVLLPEEHVPYLAEPSRMVRQAVWVVDSFAAAAEVQPEDFCGYLECAVDVVGYVLVRVAVLATDVVAAYELVRVAVLAAAYELVRVAVLAAAYELVRLAVLAAAYELVRLAVLAAAYELVRLAVLDAVSDSVQWMFLAAVHYFH